MAPNFTYETHQKKAIAGMVADMGAWDGVTGIVETEAGIGFGLAVGQGTKDKQVVLGGSLVDFRGVSIRDITLEVTDGDKYKRYTNIGILTRGRIWVVAHAAVAAGDAVHYDSASGEFSNSGGEGPIEGARWATSAAEGELAQVELNRP